MMPGSRAFLKGAKKKMESDDDDVMIDDGSDDDNNYYPYDGGGPESGTAQPRIPLNGRELYCVVIEKLHDALMTFEGDAWPECSEGDDPRVIKMYLMNVGNPMDESETERYRGDFQKTLRSEFGAVVDVTARMESHNNSDRTKCPQRTRHARGAWELVMTADFPPYLRKFMRVGLIRDYIRKAHGIKPKIERSIEVFNLLRVDYKIHGKLDAFVADKSSNSRDMSEMWEAIRKIENNVHFD